MAKRKKSESQDPKKQPVETAQITPFGDEPHVTGASRKVNKTVSRAEALGLPGESTEKEEVPAPSTKKKPKTRVGPKRSGKTPEGAKIKGTNPNITPEWAREKAVVDALTLKEKKQFLSLYNDGAPYSVFSSYLGKSRGVFDYMTTRADEIQAEVTKIEREKEEKLRQRQIEAAQLNIRSQKTGVLESPEKEDAPKNRGRKRRWECPADQQRWLVQEAGFRNLTYLTEKYHGGIGPEAEAEVAYEVERLEKAIAEYQRKQKAKK